MSAQLAQAAQELLKPKIGAQYTTYREFVPVLQRDLDALKAALAAHEAAPQQEPLVWIGKGHLREVLNGNAMNVYMVAEKDRFTEVPLYAAPQQAQAPGWQLVPVEPTPEMLDVASNTPVDPTWNMHGDFEYTVSGGDIWAAMLAAAPQQSGRTVNCNNLPQATGADFAEYALDQKDGQRVPAGSILISPNFVRLGMGTYSGEIMQLANAVRKALAPLAVAAPREQDLG